MQILFNELKNYKISLLLILVATYISTNFELMLPILLANGLNIGIIENYGLPYIKNIVIMMAIFISISIILNFFISYLINRVSIYSSTNLRNNLFEKVLSLKTYEKKKFTDA
jgi:ATP-binding cassette subfamily B protein